MAKSKNKISDIFKGRSSLRSRRSEASSQRMLGIVIGIALTISAIGVISAVSVSYAHSSRNPGESMMGDGTIDGGMQMMHSMMMDDNNGMSMMHSMMMNGQEMTQEEIDEMLESMDKDGDGQCDHCGMSVEMCRKMMNS